VPFLKNKIKKIKSPVQLPEDQRIADEWQILNRAWWESNPMRYDWKEKLKNAAGTTAYFDEIDHRFLESVKHYMPWREKPFDHLIDFSELKNKKVLEIGVGHGYHAELLASSSNAYVGIDLTKTATTMTQRRLALKKISGEVIQMDAEKMGFEDHSFDLIWSWGVIHHSSNPLKILQQMHRVLKPQGTATIMIYHRTFWSYQIAGLIYGIRSGLFFKGGSLNEAVQASTDGAIARYYQTREWKKLCSGLFFVTHSEVRGLKSTVIPLPFSRLKKILEKNIPDAVTRFLTNTLGLGSFLILQMKRCD